MRVYYGLDFSLRQVEQAEVSGIIYYIILLMICKEMVMAERQWRVGGRRTWSDGVGVDNLAKFELS